MTIKDKIIEIIFANELFNKYILHYTIEASESNYTTQDNKVLLGTDNKVLLSYDENIEIDTDTQFMSKYTSQEIDDILYNIDNYKT